MSGIIDLEDAKEMMNTPTVIGKNDSWFELRTVSSLRLLGRSTSRESMDRLQKDLRDKGYTEMESNILAQNRQPAKVAYGRNDCLMNKWITMKLAIAAAALLAVGMAIGQAATRADSPSMSFLWHTRSPKKITYTIKIKPGWTCEVRSILPNSATAATFDCEKNK